MVAVVDGAKPKKGSKGHAAVDTLGHLLAQRVGSAGEQDRVRVGELAEAARSAPRSSVILSFTFSCSLRSCPGYPAMGLLSRPVFPFVVTLVRTPSLTIDAQEDPLERLTHQAVLHQRESMSRSTIPSGLPKETETVSIRPYRPAQDLLRRRSIETLGGAHEDLTVHDLPVCPGKDTSCMSSPSIRARSSLLRT